MKNERAEIAATARKAGGKSLASKVVLPLNRTVSSTASAPTATPVDTANCWPTLISAVARLTLGKNALAPLFGLEGPLATIPVCLDRASVLFDIGANLGTATVPAALRWSATAPCAR